MNLPLENAEGLADRPAVLHGDFLSRTELKALTPQELTRRTKILAPRIAELAPEAERLRRPTDEAWQALRASGYFYQFVPKRFGGVATDLDSFIDATLPIAEACASTAWTAAFCAGHNRTLANFPEETQAELWGGDFPYIIAPQLSPGPTPAQVEVAEGGILLSGRWTWATGIIHADWVLVAAPVTTPDGPPQMIMVLFPASEARVLDTWYADGMAGTGSHDVEVRNVFVPERHILRDTSVLTGKGSGARLYAEPVYKAPLFTFSAIVAAAPILGAARGAAALFRDLVSQRVVKGSEGHQSDRPTAQIRLARADMMICTAEASLRAEARGIAAIGDLGEAENMSDRIASRARITFAVDLCRQATRLLADGAGSSVHKLDHPLQRIVRDVSVACTHVGFDVDVSEELYGRSLLGLPPNTMLF